MTQLPTYWYNTDAFWVGECINILYFNISHPFFLLDYPTWRLKPELKRYYLMQIAYWCQQMLVLVLGIEKPRKDYWELVAHHFVTLWLVG
jgi:acyl-CoA-dependent ceramide synthase